MTARQNGHSPIAVHGPNSLWVTNPINRGKRPVGAQWQLGHDDERLLANITAWTTNTGLLCGDIGGGLIGLDLDITDPAVLAAVLEAAKALLPTWLCHRRRSNSAKILIPFRAAESERGKVAVGPFLTQRAGASFENKIEVLGRGNQFVVAGHHTTGVELQWSGPPVWTMPVDDVPAVSHTQMDRFLAAAAPLLGEGKRPTRRTSSRRPASRLHPLSTGGPARLFAGGGPDMNAAAQLESGFERLSVEDKNKTLQECLWVLEPMADACREVWLSLVIACWDAARLGATEAWAMCLAWSRKSARFVSEADFDKDWASFTERRDGITVATIIFHAREEGALLAALRAPRPSDEASPVQPQGEIS